MKLNDLVYGIKRSLILMDAIWKPALISANFSNDLTMEYKKLKVSQRFILLGRTEQALNADLIDKERICSCRSDHPQPRRPFLCNFDAKYSLESGQVQRCCLEIS